MQYFIFSNDIALIMHYRALLKRSDTEVSNVNDLRLSHQKINHKRT